ncbi:MULTISPECIES: DUF6612 family protein [Bacillaceae]|uniref:Uncharacterized protein n=1 Tax=Evansella alkalicola TaxID=745819 RepID=A0ABS6JYG5_9BACI|nr:MULTISPECIES: DUF6612 family protein [Bacillaceae]MBU9723528.1 hypothetical protein [Bacillus alkalicola]
MKKALLVVFTLLMFGMMAACSDDDEEAMDNNATEENGTEDVVEDGEEVDENGADEQSEEDIANEAEEASNEETDEGNVSDSQEAASDEAHEMLLQSSEAMDNLTSYKLEMEIKENDANAEPIDSLMVMQMAFSDDVFTMYVNVSSNYEDEQAEFYLASDAMYVKEDVWYEMPRSGDEHAYTTWTDTGLREVGDFTEFSDQFDIIDNGDHYLLRLEADDYDSFWLDDLRHFGAGQMSDDVKIEGLYELRIQKESLYMLGYNMVIKAETSEGELLMDYEATLTMSDFNEYDEITPPDEVVNEAVSFGQ